MSHFLQCWLSAGKEFAWWIISWALPCWVGVMATMFGLKFIHDKWGGKVCAVVGVAFTCLVAITFVACLKCKYGTP